MSLINLCQIRERLTNLSLSFAQCHDSPLGMVFLIEIPYLHFILGMENTIPTFHNSVWEMPYLHFLTQYGQYHTYISQLGMDDIIPTFHNSVWIIPYLHFALCHGSTIVFSINSSCH
ncbi:hypothetical protein V6Z12_A04G032200 [Gossypium hirsutum]